MRVTAAERSACLHGCELVRDRRVLERKLNVFETRGKDLVHVHARRAVVQVRVVAVLVEKPAIEREVVL